MFNNAGTLTKTGTGIGTVTIPLTNTGTVDAQAGTLDLNSTFTHEVGAVLRGVGTLDISGATVTFDGDIEPGAAGTPGVLNLTGNLVLGATANLNVDIDGTTLGSGYDQLAISGNVTLGGTLNLNRDAAFIPAFVDVFSLMTYGSRTIGIDFDATNGEDGFNGDRRLNASPGATSYNAVVEAWP